MIGGGRGSGGSVGNRVSWEIRQGDALERLAEMPDGLVQCCVTSPPYFGLRDYGHEGQIGLEPTPDEYVGRLVGVFREVRRVLRDDGTLWLNVGDSYAGSWGAESSVTGSLKKTPGPKRKDLIGIPWLWAKPNPMPESVQDRPTRAHEQVFLLSKSARYFYDHAAIREEGVWKGQNRTDRGPRESAMPGAPAHVGLRKDKQRGHGRRHAGFNDRWDAMSRDEQSALGRNKRTVWTVATQPYAGAYLVTFPPTLIEPMVLAGSARDDVVLDPFAGAGTTGVVSLRHGRSFIGIELSADYCELARCRICDDEPLFNYASEVVA